MTNRNTQVAQSLKSVLGDTYALYLKTHGFHWNVTGPQFHALHTLFEEQYTQMWEALDDIAERVRTLGDTAPGSGRALAALSEIDEAGDEVPEAKEMLRILAADHETWVRRAGEALEVAREAGDDGTEDLLVPMIASHEKSAWMLRSSM
ncbi:Dps family protein [Parvularcula oceani]|uniref:Dps family protein n=1 Tax=Parvularcula oceani TaxID=1247963 RepID=UPI0004E287A2|nr:DNA starvation/stationary phase protection protein [Parvularcula oceani]